MVVAETFNVVLPVARVIWAVARWLHIDSSHNSHPQVSMIFQSLEMTKLFCSVQVYEDRTNQNLKGILHPKMKILSSFTHPQVIPNLYEFIFFWWTQKIFWRIWITKQLMVPIDLHSMEENIMKVNGDRQLYKKNILCLIEETNLLKKFEGE